MSKRPTYAQLFDRLKELGYTETSLEINGRPQRVFEHKDIETATIFLPQVDAHAPVLPRHLGMVRAVLKWNGLIEEDDYALP